MRALRPNESTHDEACANARVLSRMCSVPGAGMTRIRFKEYISVPFALVPWRALLAFADAKIRYPARPSEVRVARTCRTLTTGGTPLGTIKS